MLRGSKLHRRAAASSAPLISGDHEATLKITEHFVMDQSQYELDFVNIDTDRDTRLFLPPNPLVHEPMRFPSMRSRPSVAPLTIFSRSYQLKARLRVAN